MRNRFLLSVLCAFLLPLAAFGQTVPVGQPNGTPHSVSLTCTPSTTSGVTGYNFYRATTAGGEAGTPALNGATPTSGCAFTDTTVVAGQKYFYVAAATIGTSQSAFSGEVSVTIPTNPAPPSALTVASFSVVPSSNGKQETITATYIEPTAGAKTFYQLWSTNGLLKSGQPSVSANGSYTITWTGKISNAPKPSFTVEDDLGNVATSDKGD
jgi:hypothetical protein